jgi:hypothetical protein
VLIGLAWAQLYTLVEIAWPGSFRVPEPASPELTHLGAVAQGRLSFVYYSYVTLTTLGYGDTTPLTPPARALSYMEAMVGQVFLVVTVARLVGLQLMHSNDKGDER